METIVTDNKMVALNWFKKSIIDLNWKKPQVITIKEYRNKRSVAINSLYWMWISAISNYTGNDKNDVHEAYCRKYLKWAEKELPGGLSYWDRCHTPDADTVEFNEYLEKVHLHAYDFLNFWLPYPDDRHFKTFVEQYKYISKGMEIEYS